MDEFAHRTLELRALFRRLQDCDDLSYYTAYVRGEVSRDELFFAGCKDAEEARAEALHATMGSSNSTDSEIEARIEAALRGAGGHEFVLIGGPPCQAYSLVGRARRSMRLAATLRPIPSSVFIWSICES